MSMRQVLRQVHRLTPGGAYALVFQHRLTAEEMQQLRDMCQQAKLHVLVLTDCQVVPLDKIAFATAEIEPAELARVLTQSPSYPAPAQAVEAQDA